MHCPNCGAQALTDQKFCRACGFGLEKVAQLLAEELPVKLSEENLTPFHTRLNKLDRLWQFALAGFLTTFVGLVIWGIIDAIIIKKGQVVGGSLFIVFILGIITLALSGLYIETQRKKLADRKTQKQMSLPDAEKTNQLLAEADQNSAASIIEETTAKLEEKIRNAQKSGNY